MFEMRKFYMIFRIDHEVELVLRERENKNDIFPRNVNAMLVQLVRLRL